MDEGSQPRSGNRNNGKNQNNYGGNNSLQNEVASIKQELSEMRSTVSMLEQEKDSLRKAIRKLKVSNFFVI